MAQSSVPARWARGIERHALGPPSVHIPEGADVSHHSRGRIHRVGLVAAREGRARWGLALPAASPQNSSMRGMLRTLAASAHITRGIVQFCSPTVVTRWGLPEVRLVGFARLREHLANGLAFAKGLAGVT